MVAVMAAERTLDNQPSDVSAQKVGYNISSCDPRTHHLRFIEVKGRIDGADTVILTRQEIITSLHEPQKYILAIVQIGNGVSIRREPRLRGLDGFYFSLPIPRQQFMHAGDGDVGKAGKHIGQPFLGVDIVHLGCHDKGIHEGGSVPAAL